MRHTFFLILLSGLFFNHCQRGADYQTALITEAESYHQQAEEIQRQLLPALQDLEQERNQINIQGRALNVAERERVELIEALLEQYATFEVMFQPVEREGISRKVVTQQKASLEAIRAIWEKVQALT